MANFTMSGMPRIPSFCIRRLRYVSTDLGEMQIRAPIFALQWPSATSWRISRSRRDRLSSGDSAPVCG